MELTLNELRVLYTLTKEKLNRTHLGYLEFEQLKQVLVRLRHKLESISPLPKSYSSQQQNPKIKTTVVHSQTKPAWNVVGTELGGKYKIASIPYVVSKSMEVTDETRDEALLHARFISQCFNNSDRIVGTVF